MTPRSLADTAKALLAAMEGTTQGPWRWVDRFDFNHDAEMEERAAVDADFEKGEGRMLLVAGKMPVLRDWWDYGDSGLEVDRADAAFIAAANPAALRPLLLALVAVSELPRVDVYGSGDSLAVVAKPTGAFVLAADLSRALAVAEEQGT